MTTFQAIKKVPGKLKTLQSSFLNPEYGDVKIIPVIVKKSMKQSDSNTVYKALVRRWAPIDARFKEWYYTQRSFGPGSTLEIQAQSDIIVFAMLLEDEDDSILTLPAPKYRTNEVLPKTVLEKALKVLAATALYNKASVHISGDLLGFPEFQEQLETLVVGEGVNVNVYMGTP